MNKIIIFLYLITFFFGQETVPLSKDTVKAEKKTSSFASQISYAAESVKYTKNDAGDPITIYTGNAQIVYEDMKINAHEIIINQKKSKLYASPKRDTLETGKITLSGIPVFNQVGTDPMYGEEMEYHFLSKRGRVVNGKTEVKAEKSKYEGKEIKKIGKKTILIRDGKFTTCDSDSPSYWFHSGKIRMLRNDMLYTGPIIMTIQEIPFPIILPVGVFSLKRGKRSGIELPSYQSDTQYGRGLRELGYYWAASEYFQARLLTDYYENTGFINWKLFTEYKDRYDLNGSLNLTYSPKNPQTLEREDNFTVNFRHNHKIDPSMSINGGGQFSSKLETNSKSINFNKQVQQSLNMNLGLNKSWDNGNSLNLNSSFNQNLFTKERRLEAPTLSFSLKSGPLLGEAKDPLNKKWYEKINFSYSNNARYQWRELSRPDTLGNYNVYDTKEDIGAQHNVTLSAPIKLFKYFSLSPNLNYSEKWVVKQPEIDESFKDSLVLKEVTKFGALRTFSFGLNLNTKLFGFIEPNLFGMKILRHQISPSISFSYRPDFTKDFWGYLKDVSHYSKYNSSEIRTIGNKRYIDRFKFSTYGQTPGGESLNASISLSNNYSAKFLNENGDEIKKDLFTVSTGTSIDFLKDSLKWSDLSSSFTIPTSGIFSLSGGMSHSLYKLDRSGRPRNEFAGIPILKSFRFNTSLRLDSKLFSSKSKSTGKKEETKSDTGDIKSEENSMLTDKDKLINKLRTFDIPWNYNLNMSYNYNRYSSNKHSFSTNMNLTMSLTKNWKIQYSNSLNIQDWQLISQHLTVNRDLDCWTLSFTYSPNPTNQYFLLTFRIKEQMLEDLKYERHSRNLPID